MAKTFKPPFPQTIQNYAVDFVNADGTTMQALVAGATEGTRVDTIVATTDEVVANVLNIELYDGATAYRIGQVAIPAGAGTDGTTKAISVLNDIELPFLKEDLSILVENGWSLRVAPNTAVGSGDTLNVVAIAGDY